MNEFDFNRKAYNEVAKTYHQKRKDPEEGAWNNYLDFPAMESFLRPIVKGKKVLDLGCGTGLLAKKILNWGGDVSGMDQSEKMIQLAREDMPEAEFKVASATKVPYEDGEFDIVASSLVLHYIQDLNPVFLEVSRILERDGEFIFSVHHPFNEVFELDKKQENGLIRIRHYFNNDPYYWKMCGAEFLSFHHTFEDLIRGLSRAGFAVKDLIECRPEESCRGNFKDYEFTSQYPSFCAFRAFKL